jgi:hypothetical protein
VEFFIDVVGGGRRRGLEVREERVEGISERRERASAACEWLKEGDEQFRRVASAFVLFFLKDFFDSRVRRCLGRSEGTILAFRRSSERGRVNRGGRLCFDEGARKVVSEEGEKGSDRALVGGSGLKMDQDLRKRGAQSADSESERRKATHLLEPIHESVLDLLRAFSRKLRDLLWRIGHRIVLVLRLFIIFLLYSSTVELDFNLRGVSATGRRRRNCAVRFSLFRLGRFRRHGSVAESRRWRLLVMLNDLLLPDRLLRNPRHKLLQNLARSLREVVLFLLGGFDDDVDCVTEEEDEVGEERAEGGGGEEELEEGEEGGTESGGVFGGRMRHGGSRDVCAEGSQY